MKVQLVWSGEPSSYAVSGVISSELGVPLLPGKVDSSYALSFECKTLSDPTFLLKVAEREQHQVTAAKLARHIQRALTRHEVLHAAIYINHGGDIEYAEVCERRMFALEKAAKRAVEALKATRTWFRDHRIASIRRDLDEGLRDYLFC